MNRQLLAATRQQLALQSYLDDLLRDASAQLEVPLEAVAPAPLMLVPEPETALADEFEAAVREELVRDAARVAAPEPPLARVEAPQIEAPVIAVPPVTAPLEIPPAASEPELELMPAAEQPLAPLASEGSPDWAEAPFECLLFDVAGLTLAVPLVCLGSIYPLGDQELTPLFGQPDWFLGLLPCQAGNLKVLDTARWLMAERYRDEFREGLSYVISVQGYDWGLAVHKVSRSIRLNPAEVKWRSQRTQRPWLAGTVIEHMCALLDVTALAELIASGATRRGGAYAR